MSKAEGDIVQKTRVVYNEIQVNKFINEYSVVSWGAGKEGSLGNSSLEDAGVPQAVSSLNSKVIVQIACGAGNTLVLTSDGAVYTWGFNSVGQLGHGHFKNCSSPCLINFNFGAVVKVVSGAGHCMVINKLGELFSWGCSGHYQTGHESLTHQNFPKRVSFFSSLFVSDASCGISHSLILANQTLYSIGDNIHGQCTGKETYYKVPKPINFFNIKKIVAGGAHSLILTNSGSVAATGLNSSGQLGLGHKEEVFEFCELKVKDFVDLFAGEEISAGLNIDGKVFVWGWNGLGQLGQGHFADVLFPTMINIKGKVKSVNMGVGAVGCLTENEELYWTGYLGTCLKKDMKEKNLVPDKQLAIPQRFFNDAKIRVLAVGRTHCVAYLTEIAKGVHNDSDEELQGDCFKAEKPQGVSSPDDQDEPLKPVIKEWKKQETEEKIEKSEKKWEIKENNSEKVEKKSENLEKHEKNELHSREKSHESIMQNRKYVDNPLVTLLSFQKAKEEGRELAKNFRLYDDQIKLPQTKPKPISEDKLMPIEKKSSRCLQKVKSFERDKTTNSEILREGHGSYHFPSIYQSNILQEQRIKELESMANKYDKRISRYYQPVSPKIRNVKVSKRVGGGYMG